MTGSTKPNKNPAPKKTPYLLGVAGGSGSGKTYFARALRERIGRDRCEIVFQDNFYIDQSSRFDFDGGSINFDHPDSLDFKLFATMLTRLKSGQDIEIPVYDFATHKRLGKTLSIQPKPLIIVDGILIFHVPEVRELFDDLVFFETPEELRFKRRLERDMKERGRTQEGVHNQFYKQVKPMHDLFVEPTKIYAKTVVKDLGDFRIVLEDYVNRLQAFLQKPSR